MSTTRMDVPVGTVLDFAGTSVPSGYLECDGSAVSRSQYPRLFAAIGTTWGAGDGSTSFNLPNLGGRACIGKGSRSVGNTGGAETHTLTVSEMPKHNHQHNIYARSGWHSKQPVPSGGMDLFASDVYYWTNTGTYSPLISTVSTGGVCSQHHAALRRRAEGHTRRLARWC